MPPPYKWAPPANIIGTVTLKGTPPAEMVMTDLKEDATCGPLHTEVPTTHHYVVGPKGGLANVVVMLKGISGKSTGASAPPLVLDQKGCLYSAAILAVQTGQKIVVKNSDPVPCTTSTCCPPSRAIRRTTRPQPAGRAGLDVLISQTGELPQVQVRRASVDVRLGDRGGSSLFRRDRQGRQAFKIENVPPGKYTIETDAPQGRARWRGKEVEVKDGDVTVDFTLRS